MENLYPIGIMQGRLSKKPNKPLQSFPWDSWREEFSRANAIGFNQIEWLVDGDNDDNNPIASAAGQKKILELSAKYDVSIKSLCAHSLIDGKLLGNGIDLENAKDIFSKILSWASAINIEFVILPIMDAMSIKNDILKERLKTILREVVNINGPKVLLESDLPAVQLKQFIEEVSLENVGVLYDLGNATAMGFDVDSELKLLHPIIGEVHIKDRSFDNGGSCRLGMADTSFDTAIEILKKSLWKGSFVLETPIFDNWKNEANSNYSFTSQLVNPTTQGCEEAS